MKTKTLEKESFLQRHKYAGLIFLFVFLYNYFFVNSGQLWEVSGYAYTIHLVDFSVGFHTGVLPGAVFYGLFGEYASKAAVRLYVLVLLVIFMAVLSVLLGNVVRAAVEQKRTNTIWLVLFFIMGPFTLTNCIYWFAFFDIYLFFLSVLFFICVENRIAKYFIPVIYVAAVLTHFSSFLTCIPMFTIILLYKITQEKEQKKNYVFILGASLFLTAGLGIYLLLNESANLRYSLEDFHAFLSERGGADYASDDRAYYDYLFYHTVTVDADISFSDGWDASKNAFSNLFSYLIGYIRFSMKLMTLNGDEWVKKEITRLVLSLPFFGGYYLFVIRYLKKVGLNKKTFWSQVPLLLTLLQLPFALLALLFSTDITRWTNFVIAMLTVEIVYFLTKDRELMDSVDNFVDSNKIWMIAYLFISATSIIK